MKLEDISAEIRPRNDWEAVDLGWVLARRHYGLILKASLITFVPLWLLILGLLHQPAHLFWGMVLIWWMKPIYNRIPLFIMSRALFGPAPTLREVFRAWPGMLTRRLFHTLIGGRLSMHRTLVLPVAELEGLRGAHYRRRAEVLSLRAGQAAFWSQTVVTLLVHAVWMAIVMFLYMLVPKNVQHDMRTYFINLFGGDWSQIPMIYFWLWAFLYLTALTLIEPFHAGGGFGLYLNTRARIEGWDIELSFRRLANRIKALGATTATAAALVAVLWFLPTPAHAQDEDLTPKEAIEEVMKHPDFEVHKVKRVEYIDPNPPKPAPKPSSKSSFNFPSLPSLAGVGLSQMVFWMVIVLAILFLLTMLTVSLVNARKGGGLDPGRVEKPKVVMGLNVEPESLPPDIVTVARGFWAEGKYQEAIGLLYRGAISWLIQTGHVPIQESDTEFDCVERTKRSRHQNVAAYFVSLTRAWLRTAYGETPPSQHEAEAIFSQWPFDSQRSAS